MSSNREKLIVLLLSAISFGFGVYSIFHTDSTLRCAMFTISIVLLLSIAGWLTINKIRKEKKR